MRLLTLVALLASLTGAAYASSASNPDRAKFNLVIHLRPDHVRAEKGFGQVKFRQPEDADTIVYLDVRLRNLAPARAYSLQRATDTTVDGDCTGTNWLTLGQGPVPQAITTDGDGNADAALFRDLSAIPVGTEFDIHFRLLDAGTGAVVLRSSCHQFAVRQ
jgi:hypothetical protein